MYLYWLPSCALGSISHRFHELIIEIMWNILLIASLITKIQSGHKFAHATTAQLSWHVQNCDLILQLFFITEQQVSLWYLSFWARKPFVEEAPDEMRGTWGQYLYSVNTDALMSVSLRQTSNCNRWHERLNMICTATHKPHFMASPQNRPSRQEIFPVAWWNRNIWNNEITTVSAVPCQLTWIVRMFRKL